MAGTRSTPDALRGLKGGLLMSDRRRRGGAL